MDAAAGVALGTALQSCPALTKLDIDELSLGSAGMTALLELPPRLDDVDRVEDGADDRGGAAAGDELASCVPPATAAAVVELMA